MLAAAIGETQLRYLKKAMYFLFEKHFMSTSFTLLHDELFDVLRWHIKMEKADSSSCYALSDIPQCDL